MCIKTGVTRLGPVGSEKIGPGQNTQFKSPTAHTSHPFELTFPAAQLSADHTNSHRRHLNLTSGSPNACTSDCASAVLPFFSRRLASAVAELQPVIPSSPCFRLCSVILPCYARKSLPLNSKVPPSNKEERTLAVAIFLSPPRLTTTTAVTSVSAVCASVPLAGSKKMPRGEGRAQ
ncbi:hypothetical protein PIB30_044489 [Stylosanthes scabra]|uniref:Uncharacterized protein n=1 Tax=Stylosanthes scabra TaxID=79078 RepID=A0ABU6WG62_9FABA|nr:hypothetical protein [Stylosanthes scabra]